MKEDIYLEQIIRCYELYQEQSKNNLKNLFQSLKSINLPIANAWKDIIHYWHFINHDIEINIINTNQKTILDCLKDIKEEEKIVISILGIKLNDDGSMNDELISRLQAGLILGNILKKSYIVVTGGPTAKNNKAVTEGGEMKKWLVNHGIEEHRIIVEDRALDTVGNAVFTYQILKSQYKQIESIILVSSDYHVARGSLLYYSTLLLESAKTGGKRLNIIANIGCQTTNAGYETIYLQAWSLCQVANIDYWKLNVNYE